MLLRFTGVQPVEQEETLLPSLRVTPAAFVTAVQHENTKKSGGVTTADVGGERVPSVKARVVFVKDIQ